MMARLAGEWAADDRRLIERPAAGWSAPDMAARLGCTAAVVRARPSRRLRDLGYPG